MNLLYKSIVVIVESALISADVELIAADRINAIINPIKPCGK